MGRPWQLIGAIRPVNLAVSKSSIEKFESVHSRALENEYRELEVFNICFIIAILHMCDSSGALSIKKKKENHMLKSSFTCCQFSMGH